MMHSLSLSFLLVLLGSALQLVHGGSGMFGGGGQYVDTERPPHQCTCSAELTCDDPYDCWCEIKDNGCRCRVSAANTPYFTCQASSECCDWNDRRRRRRHRTLRQDDPNHDLELASLTDKCGEVEYDVSLHVQDAHLSAVAAPSITNTNSNNCPLLVAHSVFDRNIATNPAHKELLVWDDSQDVQQTAEYSLTELLHVGTFRLDHLLLAYQAASPNSRTNLDNKGYNVWMNNCSSFLVNLALTLDIKIDARVTQFVAMRLLQQPVGTFIESVRQSIHNGGGRYLLRHSAADNNHSNNNNINVALSDQDLVQLLVEQNARTTST